MARATWKGSIAQVGIGLPTGVGPSTGLAYDPAPDVLLLTQSPGRGPRGVCVMRYAPPRRRAPCPDN